jgi:flagellar FliL protein
MKLAMMGLVAVLLLGGAAAGAYFYFDKPAVASLPPGDEVAKEAHEAKLEDAELAAAPQEFFVELDPLIFPILDDYGVSQTISMVVSIEVPNEIAAAEVERLAPRLKDAFIQDMYGTLNRKSAMDKGAVNVGLIKDRLNKASVRILGEDKVNDVLLQVVQQRRVR